MIEIYRKGKKNNTYKCHELRTIVTKESIDMKQHGEMKWLDRAPPTLMADRNSGATFSSSEHTRAEFLVYWTAKVPRVRVQPATPRVKSTRPGIPLLGK